MWLHGFSSDFNFQIFKYFLVELWILWSKFKLAEDICLVTEYFIIRRTTNLRFRHRSEEEREVNQVLTDLSCPALLCCGWLYCSLCSLTPLGLLFCRDKNWLLFCVKDYYKKHYWKFVQNPFLTENGSVKPLIQWLLTTTYLRIFSSFRIWILNRGFYHLAIVPVIFNSFVKQVSKTTNS